MSEPASRRIPLWGRGGIRAYAVVDASDFEWLNRWRWCLGSAGYAERGIRVDGRSRTVRLHREVLGLTRGDSRQADHINRDRLDNRRANLRVVTALGNMQNKGLYSNNSSGYPGVVWRSRQRQWEACVTVDGTRVYLGLFSSAEVAHEVASACRERRAVSTR